MYKCKICGKEKNGKREMHGHFMYAHRTTYAEHNYNMADLIEEDIHAEPKEKPKGFRYLSKANDIESMAIGQGYLFNESYAANVPEDFPPIEEAPGIDTAETSGQMFRIGIPNFSWLLARTGEGALESYLNHPINFDTKLSTARIIRGLTGIAGTLDYALIDIALGVFEKVRENKAVVKVNTNEEINQSY